MFVFLVGYCPDGCGWQQESCEPPNWCRRKARLDLWPIRLLRLVRSLYVELSNAGCCSDADLPSPSHTFHILIGCFATWCPCFVFTHNKQHLRSLQTSNAPLPPGTEQTDAECCIYAGLTYCSVSWILQVCLWWLVKTRKILIANMVCPAWPSRGHPPALWYSWRRGY